MLWVLLPLEIWLLKTISAFVPDLAFIPVSTNCAPVDFTYSSKQSGVSEVIANALKVDFWDVRKMADRICAVLAYPALGRLMVRNCANELKNIRWENAAAKLERVYGALAARGN